MAKKIKSKITYDAGRMSKKLQKELYLNMLRPRMIEEKMLILLRQGKISKWFSGIGQEAISVGCTMAMQPEETVFPMHRNLGVFTSRQVPLFNLFCQWQGKMPGFTKGRDRSFHFGAPEFNIVGMISHLGPQLSLSAGVGLSHLLNNEANVSLAFTGEGGTSEGEFHEALNTAAVWSLPVIFVIENNGYGLSTPAKEQYACKDLADKGVGYGMESYILDGNNILEVYSTMDKIAKSVRKNPRPILVECKTFRMRGHEEASGTKYVPKELMEKWAEKDPLENYERFLINEKIIDELWVATQKASIKEEINNALKEAAKIEERIGDQAQELDDVFQSHDFEITKPSKKTNELRMIDAISDGLKEGMKKFDNLILMGQDIAEYGGVFKITDGFVNEFGKDRVRNTPLCESAILGIGIGLSIRGMKSMVEMQFGDFVTCGFNQIVNNAAKLHYRWGQNVDMVVRMPCGGGVGAGPFHSQTNEAWFFHVPGLKIVYPSSPRDAKGLLLAALEDPNPVLFFEHKALYRNMTQDVPKGYYTEEIGKAKLVSEGDELSIITYGMGVLWAKAITEEMEIEADILDLRSLSPIDYSAIIESVKKTNRVLILHEDSLTGGIGGEISAYISEHHFEYLDAPIVRCGSMDTPFPFAGNLEKEYLANFELKNKLNKLLAY